MVYGNGIFVHTVMPRQRPSMTQMVWTRAYLGLWVSENIGKVMATLVGSPFLFMLICGLVGVEPSYWAIITAIILPFHILFHVMWRSIFWRWVVFHAAEYEDITGKRLLPDFIRPLYKAAKLEQARMDALREMNLPEDAPSKGHEHALEKMHAWKAQEIQSSRK
jgi:hypothetical protein